MVLCEEVLKAKAYTIVYSKGHEEDEETIGFSYQITTQKEHDASCRIEIDEE